MASIRSMRDQIAAQDRKITVLQSHITAQDGEITILKSCVAAHERNITRILTTLAFLMNMVPQNISGRASPSVQLPDEPRSPPENRTADSNRSYESTGTIFWNSIESSRSIISSGGDIDLSAMLLVLRREAFGYLQDWRPIVQEIKNNKRSLIRAILSPAHIHKFKNDQSIFTVGKNSVWPSIVAQVFPEARGDKKLRMRLMKCMSSAKGTGKFAKFAASVVQAHGALCQTCNPLD